MSEHFPKVRIYTEDHQILIRDGLDICFYMRRSHRELAQGVQSALELYRRAIAPRTLDWYVDHDGEWQPLDARGWDSIHRELFENSWPLIELKDAPGGEQEFRFEYRGKWFEDPRGLDRPDMVSAVSFWLPTEFLEVHGPSRVQALALELAECFPLDSGHAGLAFNALTGLLSGPEEWRRLAFRYPGMDFGGLGHTHWYLGTRIRAPHWLTFLGPSVLGALGGAPGLRARLSSPDTTIQPLQGDRAVVTLGPWPDAGDLEAHRTLPKYRELALVLKPWLYQQPPSPHDWTAEYRQRWERRFLDLLPAGG
ncbi:DUF3396 domain-containing protein [Hyalangium versicolor]|uniref:DUF3396 domain-containing protein n=1 Tax=Hyalangium versicolor TaxID=2861190 RepID=UPI001CCE7A19|nr:DUF3396 domain-containing protein [Hyalangium versicolor]